MSTTTTTKRTTPPDAGRILVVDDEPTICRALTMALMRAGYHVLATGSGEHAHRLLREERFDALVVDLRMPDMRGDELFELAASIQPHLRARTLFTTGDTSDRADELIGACRCPVLLKPFDLDQLLGVVAGMVRREEGRSASA